MTRTPFVDGDWDFWKLYDAGEWEPETHAVLERFLTPGSLFVDIGAWIGPVTLWACDLGAHVVAVEPDPVAFDMLVQNVAALEVVAYQAALAARTGTACLAAFSDRLGYGDSQSRLADEGITVQTIDPGVLRSTLDTSPALVKLDIEGGELEVLPGLLSWGCPIYLSWHQPWWRHPVSERTRSEWFTGYRLEPIRGDGWTGFSELLAVPQ